MVKNLIFCWVADIFLHQILTSDVNDCLAVGVAIMPATKIDDELLLSLKEEVGPIGIVIMPASDNKLMMIGVVIYSKSWCIA